MAPPDPSPFSEGSSRIAPAAGEVILRLKLIQQEVQQKIRRNQEYLDAVRSRLVRDSSNGER